MRTLNVIFILAFSALLISFSRPGDVKPGHKTLSDSSFVVGDVVAFTPVYFNLGRCTLLADKDSVFSQTDSLKPVVKFINDHPNFVFEIRNHTDTVNPHASTKYTACRAKSVLDRMIELGADKNRLTAKGMGDIEPLKLSHTLYLPSGDSLTAGAVLTHRFIASRKSKKDDWEYLRMKNRRTDLKIVRTDYVEPVDTLKK